MLQFIMSLVKHSSFDSEQVGQILSEAAQSIIWRDNMFNTRLWFICGYIHSETPSSFLADCVEMHENTTS